MAGSVPRSLQILALPIKNRVWAFHASSPAVPGSATAGGLSFAGLWQSLKQAQSTQERADLLDEWGTQKAQNQWAALEKAPPESFKARIARWGNALMRQAHPGEQFLKSIPRDVGIVEVVYPMGLNPTLVRRRVRLLARRGQEYHRCWTYLTAAALPLSSILSILPLPNLVLFYNLFRAHANWHAWKGGDHLMKALEHTAPVEASESGEERGRESEAVRIPSEPSPSNTSSVSKTAGLLSQECNNSTGKPDQNGTRPDLKILGDANVAFSRSDAVSSEGDDSDGVPSTPDTSLDGSDGKNGAQASEAAEVVRNLRFGRMIFRPSKSLAELAPTLVDARGIPVLASLSEERIARICKDLGLEETLILRWRDVAKATAP
ncbi:hypothetical protein KFL_002080050 [Klebsormidium nitens]|uniref:Uncharacterized protein n=1 Tax=Klebsormidium nitens TaxID=105231 RepID=A0A1Y1I9R6_KLENI|nr:hypothetical protein KFL_002080050 [Klebsormidium nitens]|eukprot:GAQ84828.1 hypothetical protein KFL_002080050 [Klebsormidium nitens]